MKLTKENFLEHFLTLEPFFIVEMTNIKRCLPLRIKDKIIYYQNGFNQCKTQNIDYYSDLEYSFNAGNVYSTWTEAKLQLRSNFKSYIDYMNKSYWKENPIIIIEPFEDMK